jgi:hypothetical protein
MIPVRHPAQVQIVLQVVHTVTGIHDLHQDHLPIVAIVQLVVHTETATRVQVHVQVQIDHVAKTHTVATAHALAMTATRVRHRVTANVVDVQIVPEVVSPMIAKSVHAVALAKSA